MAIVQQSDKVVIVKAPIAEKTSALGVPELQSTGNDYWQSLRERRLDDSTLAAALAYEEVNGFKPVRPYFIQTCESTVVTGSIREIARPGRPTTNGAWQEVASTPFGSDLDAFTQRNRGHTSATSIVQAALMSARADANAKVRDQQVSLAEDILELRGTASTVVGIFVQLRKAAQRIRRKDFDGAARALGFQAAPGSLNRSDPSFWSHWLAYRYMWEPLMRDVVNALKLYNESKAGKPKIHVVKGRASSEDFGTTNVSVGRVIGRLEKHNAHQIQSQNSHKWTWEVGYVYRLTNPELVSGKQWGIIDPLSLAWDMTRRSFLIDWVLNIGDVIGQFGAWWGAEFVTGYETFVLRAEYVQIPHSFQPSNSSYWTIEQVNPSYVTHRVFRMDRRVLYEVPPVTLAILPHITVKRAIDAIALFALALSGRPSVKTRGGR